MSAPDCIWISSIYANAEGGFKGRFSNELTHPADGFRKAHEGEPPDIFAYSYDAHHGHGRFATTPPGAPYVKVQA